MLGREFQGTHRFELRSRLGQGGMGVVYEAYDRVRDNTVALKTLRTFTAAALLRFKREFRSLQDIRHPNLVSLGELHEEAGTWFFTMELVRGVDFLEYVRGRPGTDPAAHADTLPDTSALDTMAPERAAPETAIRFDEARLRSATHQLGRGLHTLHEAGKVHRDIKPSNVLITPEGRLVLLDFGLVTEIEDATGSSELDLVGTAAYMAPEQAAAKRVGAEADWYSVGVMLYQVLTGRLPHRGSSVEMLVDKQRFEPPAPARLVPTTPEDLDALCTALLRFDPIARDAGRRLFTRIFGDDAGSAALRSVTHAPPFVGRESELSELRAVQEQARWGSARMVLLAGESGAGKTALAHRCVEDLTGETVVLTGRCYEQESVPYKAFDGVVDALSHYMLHLRPEEAAALVPLHASFVAQVFPVMRRVPAMANAPKPLHDLRDPQELRSRLFGALRELLVRLAQRRSLVILIDDLQWADADSLALIEAIFRGGDAPALLLLATIRDFAVREVTRALSLPHDVLKVVTVGVLPPADARKLVTLLAGTGPLATALDPAVLAAEAGGHPLFIDELVRHGLARSETNQERPRLEDALWSRVSALAPEDRLVLEVIALAGGPVARAVVVRAAGLDRIETDKRAALLRVSNLVRTSVRAGSDCLEVFHDRIRQTIVSHLDGERQTELHRALALALEGTASSDVNALAAHWHRAGDGARALHYVTLAASEADQALAFDRSVELYQLALELEAVQHPPSASDDEGRRRRLLVRLGDALANAGRGAEAAAAFREASGHGALAAEALDLERRAADQLLRSGRIQEGLAAVERVLGTLGLRMPATPRAALVSLLLRRAHLRLRGLRFRQRDMSQVSAEELARIDTCWIVGLNLATVDQIRGADFQARCMLFALQSGEPYRICRALAIEAGHLSAEGISNRKRVVALLERAGKMSATLRHPHAEAIVKLVETMSAMLMGFWNDGVAHAGEASSLLRERCTGVAWELGSANLCRFTCMYYLGELRELARLVPLGVQEAQDRGDRYAATTFRTAMSNAAWLAVDDPRAARWQVDEAMRSWSPVGFHLQHYWEMFSRSQIDLYEARAQAGYARLAERWPALRRSLLLRVQIIRCEARYLRGRCALAAAGETRDAQLLAVASGDARRLAAEGTGYAKAWSSALTAGVAAARGFNEAAAAAFERAAADFEAANMALFAAAARVRLGRLRGADGRAAEEQGMASFVTQGVRAPERLLAMLVPGPPAP